MYHFTSWEHKCAFQLLKKYKYVPSGPIRSPVGVHKSRLYLRGHKCTHSGPFFLRVRGGGNQEKDAKTRRPGAGGGGKEEGRE